MHRIPEQLRGKVKASDLHNVHWFKGKRESDRGGNFRS